MIQKHPLYGFSCFNSALFSSMIKKINITRPVMITMEVAWREEKDALKVRMLPLRLGQNVRSN
ncbi:hypothetical protein [Holospora curviuscula]|uniref:Uncharacterized protein n=1 Tax=Holospora curviuscula TaxID=1082868 RepID=A0A2S5R7S3_9PROT|nr:hypothetical protein [Holospora curviuscula]PPE03232.1 hypothetical protein HCUR_01324 [Holospora curviuscula]